MAIYHHCQLVQVVLVALEEEALQLWVSKLEVELEVLVALEVVV